MSDTAIDSARVRAGARRAALGVNAVATGALLGVLQWSVFFLLQSYVASTAIVYLLATSVWLLGSLGGLAAPGRRGELAWMAAMLGAYYGLRYVATRHAYDLRYLPALLGAVAVMGSYAGRFFRCRAEDFGAVKWLFFWENCGFIGGTVLTVIALYGAGEALVVSAPWRVCLFAAATAALIDLVEPDRARDGRHGFLSAPW